MKDERSAKNVASACTHLVDLVVAIGQSLVWVLLEQCFLQGTR